MGLLSNTYNYVKKFSMYIFDSISKTLYGCVHKFTKILTVNKTSAEQIIKCCDEFNDILSKQRPLPTFNNDTTFSKYQKLSDDTTTGSLGLPTAGDKCMKYRKSSKFEL